GSGFPAGNTGNASNFAGQDLYSIIVDPSGSSVVYLAGAGTLYRSMDAGVNWTPGTGATGTSQSLALDATSPVNARILYAGVNGSGVSQSTDGGQSWTQIFSSGTPALAAVLGPGGS